MILDLPYKVVMIEKEKINFSIVILTQNNNYNLPNILNKLLEFRNMKGEVYVLDIGSTDNTINIAREWGCIVEDGSSFIRTIDEEMCSAINNKFNMDDKENIKIVNINDTYIDYSSAKNYATTLTTNNMILMININSNIININTLEINNLISGYHKINFNSYNNDNDNVVFYDKSKFKWFNITLEKLIHFQSTSDNTDIKEIKIPENLLRIDSTKNIVENLTALAVNCYIDNSNEKISQKFAKSLLNNKFLHSSYKEFHKHLSLTDSNVKKSETLVYIGDYFIETQREAEAYDYYHKAYLECSTMRTPLYKLGTHFYFKNEREKAIFYLEGCLNIPKPEKTNELDFIYEDGPHSMLYVAYWWIGKPEKGKYYFDKALEINPYNQLYIDEAIYHYKYKGNIIRGDLSFQEIQFLYEKSTKSKNVLEILPNNGRSTHALINGCDGLITIIMENENDEFLKNIQNPGNLRIIISPIQDAINKLKSENEKFDMVYINDYINIPDSDHLNRLNLESLTNKFLCGSKYNILKQMIDQSYEISGCKENIWYKDISSFEKITIYKKKNIKNGE